MNLLSASAIATVLLVPISAQKIIYAIEGDTAGNNFGIALDTAGDVDSDGFADLVIGIWTDRTMGLDAGAARVVSGRTGATIHQFFGAAAGDGFGITVSGAGDVNLDGHADVIIGAWRNDARAPNAGSAVVFSGKDGTVLHTFLGDSSGDGFADVVVGAHKDDNNGRRDSGMARVFSGRTGAVLYTWNGDSAGDRFAQSVGWAGDVNADGRGDVIVGAWLDDNNGMDSGSAKVFSGLDGKVLYALDGDSPGDSFGDYVSYAGDVNRDGIGDFIVGATGDDNTAVDSGSARVFSGLTGNILHTFNGDRAGDYFGYRVNTAGDVNKDGYADLIVGACCASTTISGAGMARVLSGRDGTVLFTRYGTTTDEDFGLGVAPAGDVDCDGFDDVAISADLNDPGGRLDAGKVWVYSGEDLALTTDRHTISLTAGGTQAMSLDFTSIHGNRQYWVFGSLTGIKPGTPVGAVRVPLVVDAWTLVTFTAANTPLLMNFSGQLGPSGTASPSLVVPPNQPSSALGLTFHHAALVYDSANYYTASNPVPLTLIK